MDLNAPLGLSPPPKPPRRRGLVLAAVALLATTGVLAALGYTLSTGDPHGGEPYVVSSIPAASQKPKPVPAPQAVHDPVVTGSIASPAALPPAPVSGPDPATARTPSGPLIIDVAKTLADRQQHVASIAQPAISAPVAAAVEPRVAIFVGGMGLDAAATRTATEIMPGAVTLAFVPHGTAVADAVATAKARGHEILLQVPMQNGTGPAPGPHALRPGETPQQIAEDASWLMDRFKGYDGVTNLLGAPVTSDKPAMSAFLKAVAGRGLFFVDDGTSRRSLALPLAAEAGLPVARADVVLDATGDPAVVHANLEALVAIAKSKGSAIGMASGLPDHLTAIAAFAADLAARDVKLVPVGTLVARDSSVAVAR